MKNLNLNNELSLFLLLLAPLFSFIWHLENFQFPISDSVEYLDSAYSIYLFLEKGEYLNFLISIFNERGWRPIAFQLYIFPFMIISSGDILSSVLMTHVFFNTLSTVMTYKIFRSLSINTYSSVISALIIGLSFNIMFGGQPIPLFAEVAFIAFLLGSIYFLIKSDLFKTKRNSRFFVLFFTLTILTRPIEGLIILLPALGILIFKRYSNYISLREILGGLLYPIFFVWLLFFSRIFPEVSSSVIKVDPPYSEEIFFYLTYFVSIILFFLIAIILFLKIKNNIFYSNSEVNYFKRSFFVSSLVLWIWYTPRFGSLYGWVYDTSIGDTFSYLKTDIPLYSDLILSAIKNNGEVLTYSIIFLLILSFFARLFLTKDKLFDFKNIDAGFENFTIILLASIPIPIILFFSTHQITYRKISPVMVLLAIFTLTLILKNHRFNYLNNFFITLYLFLHITFLTNHIYKKEDNITWIHNSNKISKMILGYQYPKPIKFTVDRYENLISFLKNERNKNFYTKLTLVLKDDEYPIERYLFKFMCRINNLQCKFFYPQNLSKGDFSELNSEEALLIILSEEHYVMPPKVLGKKISLYIEENSEKMSVADINAYNFLYLMSKGQLSEYNFQLKKCYNFIENFHSCLIRKIH